MINPVENPKKTARLLGYIKKALEEYEELTTEQLADGYNQISKHGTSTRSVARLMEHNLDYFEKLDPIYLSSQYRGGKSGNKIIAWRIKRNPPDSIEIIQRFSESIPAEQYAPYGKRGALSLAQEFGTFIGDYATYMQETIIENSYRPILVRTFAPKPPLSKKKWITAVFQAVERNRNYAATTRSEDVDATQNQFNRMRYWRVVLPWILEMTMKHPIALVNFSKTTGPMPLVRNFNGKPIEIRRRSQIKDFMSRAGTFEGAGTRAFSKALISIYYIPSKTGKRLRTFTLDFDISDVVLEDELQARKKLVAAAKWLNERGYIVMPFFTGSSWHLTARKLDGGIIGSYGGINKPKGIVGQIIVPLAKAIGIPLRGSSSHIPGQVTLDYQVNKANSPLRFPLSLHKSGYAEIPVSLNRIMDFDKSMAHPSKVLENLKTYQTLIEAFFDPILKIKPKKNPPPPSELAERGIAVGKTIIQYNQDWLITDIECVPMYYKIRLNNGSFVTPDMINEGEDGYGAPQLYLNADASPLIENPTEPLDDEQWINGVFSSWRGHWGTNWVGFLIYDDGEIRTTNNEPLRFRKPGYVADGEGRFWPTHSSLELETGRKDYPVHGVYNVSNDEIRLEARASISPHRIFAGLKKLVGKIGISDDTLVLTDPYGLIRLSDLVKKRRPNPPQNFAQEAIEHFGVTYDPTEAGFILPDGTMLDFSGRHEAQGYQKRYMDNKWVPVSNTDYLKGQRSTDHRQVYAVMGTSSEGITEMLYRFMRETGAIRLVNPGAEMVMPPTDEQRQKLLYALTHFGPEVYLDFTDPNSMYTLESIDIDPIDRESLDSAIDRYYSSN